MNPFKIILPLALYLLSTTYAQTFTMSNGTTDISCSGTLYDPGGTGDYPSGSNVTYTICSDNGGSVILDFTSFDTESGYDDLTIYSGSGTSNLIGTYEGNALAGQTITSNTGDGCLTLVFSSDFSVQYSGFTATISCGPPPIPCQAIQTNINYSVAPVGGFIDICQGDVLNLSTTTNYPENNTNYSQSDGTSTFEWGISDGSIVSGQNASYQFNNEGIYFVNLYVTDANGCVNDDQTNQIIRVSTTPIWDGTVAAQNTICIGEQNTLTGVVQTTPSQINCTPPQSGTTFLPDGNGVFYSTSTTVNCFNASQTVNSLSDILDVCITMEHSYLGDLGISLTCPDGVTTVDFLTYANNSGGGDYLGEPVDNDGSMTPGVGYTYCFAPLGNNGLLLDDDNLTVTNYTDGDGNATSGNIVNPGVYNIEGNWADFIGCPLNGDWTITISDNIGSDNGYVFEWSMNFDPGLTPPLLDFQPTVVTENWQNDPTIVSTSGNTITVQPTAAGQACYTYEMTDDWDCTYDTTICFTVLPANDPACGCNTTIVATPTACDPSSNTFDLNIQIDNATPPASGTMEILGCDGTQLAFYNTLPLPNSVTLDYFGETPDGTNCTVQVIYSDDATCDATVNYVEPLECCPAQIGTFSNEYNGMADNSNNYTLCAGDSLLINSNEDFTNPSGSVNPFIAYAIYSCPPTPGMDFDIDPCFTGYMFGDGTSSDLFINDIQGVYDLINGTVPLSNNTFYLVPITAIDFTTLVEYNPTCWDQGPIMTIVYDDDCCNANAGTINDDLTNVNSTESFMDTDGVMNYVLCDQDQIDFYSNQDFTNPPNFDPANTPGLGWALFSCLPDTSVDLNDPANAACFLGAVNTNDLSILNDNNTFGTNPLYVVPFTFIDLPSLLYDPNCYAYGEIFKLHFLPTVNINETVTCTDVTFDMNGGHPEIFGTNFTVTNTGGTGTLSSSTVANLGTTTLSNLNNGDLYEITVTSDAGCTYIFSGGPFQALPNIDAGLPADTCGLSYLLNATSTWTGADLAALNASWSLVTGPGNVIFGSSNALQTNVSVDQSGTYTFEILVQNGASACTATDQVQITFSDVSFTYTTTDASCGNNDGGIQITNPTGIPAFNLICEDFSGNPAGNIDLVSMSINNLATGTYVVTMTDNIACNYQETIIISNNAPHSIDLITPTHLSCYQSNDGQLDIDVTGFIGTLTYEIIHQASGQIYTQVGNDIFTGLPAGNYAVNVTDDANNCLVSDVAVITEPNELLISESHIDMLCFGEYLGVTQINLSAQGGTSPYTFDLDGNVSATGTFNDLAPGTYTGTVTDANNCVSSMPIIIDEPAPISYQLNINNISCAGSSDGYIGITNLTGGTVTGTYNVNWSSPTGNNVPAINAVTGNALSAGQYFIEITDDNGCLTDTLITLSEPSALNFGNVLLQNISCNGDNDGSITINTTFATQYAINNGAFSTNNTFPNLSAGTYTLSVGSAACHIDTVVTLTEPDLLTLNVSNDTTVCNGSTFNLNAYANGGTGNYVYNFNNTGFNNANTYAYTANGDATIIIRMNDGACPNVTEQVNISVFDPLVLDVQVDPVGLELCLGDAFTANAYVSGGTGSNYTYEWTNQSGNVLATTPDFLINPISSQSFTITVNDICNNPVSEEINVTVHPIPSVNISVNILEQCEIGVAEFMVNNPNANENFIWDFSNGNTISNTDNFTNTFNTLGCIDLSVTVVSNYSTVNCAATYDFDSVICIYENPFANFSFEGPVTILDPSVDFINLSQGAQNYLWNFNNEGTSTQTNPTWIFDAAEAQEVWINLWVEDTLSGCTDVVEKTIFIIEDLTVYVPNSFTPGADGVNDMFRPVLKGHNPNYGYRFRIFDRWGMMVFDSTNPEEGWDGTAPNGKFLKEGVYVWTINVNGLYDQSEKEFKGHVNLLKME